MYIFGWITSNLNIFRRTSSGAFKPQKKDASSPHSTFYFIHFKWVVRRLIWVVTSHISKGSWSTSAGRRLSRTVSTRLATDRQVTNQLVILRILLIWHLEWWMNGVWCCSLILRHILGKTSSTKMDYVLKIFLTPFGSVFGKYVANCLDAFI